jgi:hypothetical protein
MPTGRHGLTAGVTASFRNISAQRIGRQRPESADKTGPVSGSARSPRPRARWARR